MSGKILKGIFLILLFSFLVLLVLEETGYYQTRTSKVKTLTEEQIKLFEEDIKAGKEIDIEEYVVTRTNYANELSNNIYKISLKLEKGVDSVIKFIFKKINNMVDE